MPDDPLTMSLDADPNHPRVPVSFDRALEGFSRHDAEKNRHLDLLDRLRTAAADNEALRTSMERLLEHTASANAEMVTLRRAVGEYTRALRASGTPPEAAVVLVKKAVDERVASLARLDRPFDSMLLKSELAQSAIEAYFAA